MKLKTLFVLYTKKYVLITFKMCSNVFVVWAMPGAL